MCVASAWPDVRCVPKPIFNILGHLVHPLTGDHMLFDVRGAERCPDCGARFAQQSLLGLGIGQVFAIFLMRE